jgi:hypothetical protein
MREPYRNDDSELTVASDRGGIVSETKFDGPGAFASLQGLLFRESVTTVRWPARSTVACSHKPSLVTGIGIGVGIGAAHAARDASAAPANSETSMEGSKVTVTVEECGAATGVFATL